MVRPLDGSRPRLSVSLPSQPAAGEATPTEAPSRPPLALGATFDEAKKKLQSLGRTNTKLAPVPRNGAPPPGTLQVKDLVRSGATGAAKPASLDASGKAALDALKKDRSPLKSLAFQEATKNLTPEQRVAVARALPRDVRTAMMKDIQRAPEQIMGDTAVALTQSMSKDELKAVVADLRAHPPRNTVAIHLAVSAELAARSRWGQSHPDNIGRLREGIASGSISFKADRGAALTEMKGPQNLGHITVDPRLLASPQGLAATLAHESQHSLNATNKANNSPLEEETQGNAAGAEVFSQVGDARDPAVSEDDRRMYAEYTDMQRRGGIDGVGARVGAYYSKVTSEEFKDPTKAKFQNENRAYVNEMAKAIAAKPKVAANLTPDHAQKLVTAVLDVTANTAAEARAGNTGASARIATAIDTLASVFKNASPAALTAARDQIRRDSGAEGLARFDAALKK